MKKKLLVIAITFLCMTALFSCEKHTHDYGNETIVEADCSKNGIIAYICTCGETYEEIIPAIQTHTWDTGVITTEVSCMTDGITMYTCSICSESKEETIPAIGEHKWGEAVTEIEATCAVEGQSSKTCEACGAVETAMIAKLEIHTWNNAEETKKSTCVEEGVLTYTCVLCGEIKTEKIPMLDEHKWNAGVITKKPTCKDMGEMTYTCQICHETQKKDTSKTNAHVWDNGTVTKAATCTNDGERRYICTVCQKPTTEPIAATWIHQWNAGVVTKNATCGETGTKTYTCSICNTTKNDTIPKTYDHVWDSGKETVTATAITKGEITYTCKTCKITQKDTVQAKGSVWGASQKDNNKAFVDYNVTHCGEYSYCLTAETPGHLAIVQDFQLQPGTLYEITVDVKTEDVICHSEERYQFGASISVDGSTIYNNSLYGDSDWTTLSITAKSDENGKLEILLNLGYWFGKCTGTVWYDNLRIAEYKNELKTDEIYDDLMSFQKTYPEGKFWGDDTYYAWNGGMYTGGYGCAGFVFMLSDGAFGTLPARQTNDLQNLRVGDILRINNDTHSVIILEINDTYLTIAEGNFNDSVHWGGKINISDLSRVVSFVITRYPE